MCPAASQGVEVGAADTAVGDFDIDDCFFPGLGREIFLDHVAFGGEFVEAELIFEFVVWHVQ